MYSSATKPWQLCLIFYFYALQFNTNIFITNNNKVICNALCIFLLKFQQKIQSDVPLTGRHWDGHGNWSFSLGTARHPTKSPSFLCVGNG